MPTERVRKTTIPRNYWNVREKSINKKGIRTIKCFSVGRIREQMKIQNQESVGSSDKRSLQSITQLADMPRKSDEQIRSSTLGQRIEPWIESVPRIRKYQRNVGDALTHPTCCSAFEMVSFEALCGGEGEHKSRNGKDDIITQLPGHRSIGNSSCSLGIPHEISFETIDRTKHGKFRQEMEIKGRPASHLFDGLRNLMIWGRRTRNVVKVTRVTIYVENPKPLKHTNSVEDSTVTWHAEYRQDPIATGHRQDGDTS
jgi:hypothetical protein